MFNQLGLVGCGLMGGSFALALRRAGLVQRVVGYSKSPRTTERARQLGIIDTEAASALAAASGSDLVLVAVPVASTEATLKAIRHALAPHTLVMDVGSTKRDVVDAARRALQGQFGMLVPAHPIAGKEVSGIEHADADLYRGRQVILTPTEKTLSDQLQRATALWTALGCKVLHMSPEQHDAAFAAVSHLPHLLAFAAVNALCQQPEGQHYLGLAGSGFRDFSRIAASEPTMWRDILLANREEVLLQSSAFRRQLEALEQRIAAGDAEALEALIAQASQARAQWTMASHSNPT
ncbi:prephenate dehydrogenase [Rhodoferax sp.]|jgi:prephenate dehydrogenase|uniref:prephenate dehydrogenase n=1 Tax=Rhodoferax sp. TaxID=50421 RepID=UPI0037848241